MLTAIGARGLMRYIDGRVKQPIPFAMSPTTGELLKADGKPATDAEIEALDEKTQRVLPEKLDGKTTHFLHPLGQTRGTHKALKSASMIWVESANSMKKDRARAGRPAPPIQETRARKDATYATTSPN